MLTWRTCCRAFGLLLLALHVAAAWPQPVAARSADPGAEPLSATPLGDTVGNTLGDTLGVVTMFSQGQPLQHLPALNDLGVRWVRDAFGWAETQRLPGTYEPWSASVRQRLWFYRENRIRVVALLCCENRVAFPPTSDRPLQHLDPQAFGAYAVEVARRLKAAGVDFVLEVWNEPHNTLKALGGQWQGRAPSPWLDHYVKLVHEVVRQVKAYDPSIEVLNDDDMWVVHYWMLEAGLPPALDGLAVHPYSPSPEKAAVQWDTDWVRPFTAVDRDGSFTSAVRRLREAATRKLGRPPKMWITEWGWPLGSDAVDGKVSEALQADYLVRAYVLAHAAGVRATMWFSLIDWNDGPFGLLANNGFRRPAYRAFKTLADQLGPYRLVRQVLGAGRGTAGAQAYLYRRGSDAGDARDPQRLVAWHVGPGASRLPLDGPLAQARVVNVRGEPVPPERGPDGRAFVTLTGSPVYVAGWLGHDAGLDAALGALR